MNRSRRAATISAMSGSSTRSALSTSIRRRPFTAYLTSIALISDDLPVPREPVRRTLFAGKPATNCRVFASIARFCSSTATRWSRRIEWGCSTGCRYPRPARLRQRKAVALQSGGAACGGSIASTRSRMLSRRAKSLPTSLAEATSAPIVGIDADVFVRKIAGPDRRRRVAASQRHAHRDLVVLHHALARALGVRRRARALRDDLDIVEPEGHARRGLVWRGPVAARADDPAK